MSDTSDLSAGREVALGDGEALAATGLRVVSFAALSSTNRFALDLPTADFREGLVIWAARQTGGRGRLGRVWESPEGGLWFSLCLGPHADLARYVSLNLSAGLAVAWALAEVFGVEDLGVKWPNDVVHTPTKKKLCGILTESQLHTTASPQPASGKPVYRAALGIGVNVNNRADAFPPPVCDTATSLTELTGKTYDTAEVLAAILHRLATLLAPEGSPQMRSLAAMMEEWSAIAYNARLKIETAAGVINGRFRGVDAEGHLLLLADRDDILRTITAGTVLSWD